MNCNTNIKSNLSKEDIADIKERVLLGLCRVSVKEEYGPKVFAAFKDEINRVFDNYDLNMAAMCN